MGGDLVLSPFLQVEWTDDQTHLFNPTAQDVQIGAIPDQCMGKKAKKVISKFRIEFVSGNINIYLRSDPKWTTATGADPNIQ